MNILNVCQCSTTPGHNVCLNTKSDRGWVLILNDGDSGCCCSVCDHRGGGHGGDDDDDDYGGLGGVGCGGGDFSGGRNCIGNGIIFGGGGDSQDEENVYDYNDDEFRCSDRFNSGDVGGGVDGSDRCV